MDVINEYEQVLIGNLPKIPPRLFQNEPSANEHLALSVFRYAIEKLLRWTPMEAYRLFSTAVIGIKKIIPVTISEHRRIIALSPSVNSSVSSSFLVFIKEKNLAPSNIRYWIHPQKKNQTAKKKHPFSSTDSGNALLHSAKTFPRKSTPPPIATLCTIEYKTGLYNPL